jgi:hypothetical protein
VKALKSEHPFRRRTPLALGVLAFLCALLAVSNAGAQGDPPQPDFYWPYGRVQLDGANIDPEQQTVIALVNGKACGEATTKVAVPGPGVAPEDAGKTVYVVDVLHDGAGAGQRPGCGTLATAVAFYFPQLGRFAVQQPGFVTGGQRVDLDLGPQLGFRAAVPLVAND